MTIRPIYWLTLFVPVCVWLGLTGAPATWVFAAACLAILPLAGLMGEATEHLTCHTGPTLGGLLNASFGNAAELIIGFIALRAGEIEIVKASITGSILGNLLAVLGLAMVAGGWRRTELRFNRLASESWSGMLTLAVVALVIPAIYDMRDVAQVPGPGRVDQRRHLVDPARDLRGQPAVLAEDAQGPVRARAPRRRDRRTRTASPIRGRSGRA